MAEGKITITILSESGDGRGKGGGGSSKKEKTPAELTLQSMQKLMHPLRSAGELAQETAIDILGGSGNAISAVGIGAKVVSDAATTAYSIAMMEYNRSFSLREDYIGQNRLNAFQTQIGTTKSLLSSIGSGALAGAAMGLTSGTPAGVLIGGLIGGVSSGIKTAINARAERDQKIEQYNMQLNATNARTQFNASRASLVNGGRGTEN